MIILGLMSAFTDFVTEYSGQPNVGDTPENLGECVGLIEIWLDKLGVNSPHIYGNAIDLLTSMGNEPSVFSIIKNSATNFPGEGDIVVLGKPYGLLPDGTYAGHTGIATKSCSATVLELFEQNDPNGHAPQIKQYTYNACLGWSHPLILDASASETVMTTPSSPTQNVSVTDSQLTDQLNAEIAAVTTCQSQLKEANAQITALQSSLTTANSQVADLQNRVKTLQDENTSLTNTSKDLNSKYVAAQGSIISLKEQIVSNQSEDMDYAKEALESSQAVTSLQNDLQKIAAVFDINIKNLSYDQVTQKILTEQEVEERLAKGAHTSLQILQELGQEIIEKVEEMSPMQLGSKIMFFIRSTKKQTPVQKPQGIVSRFLLWTGLFTVS